MELPPILSPAEDARKRKGAWGPASSERSRRQQPSSPRPATAEEIEEQIQPMEARTLEMSSYARPSPRQQQQQQQQALPEGASGRCVDAEGLVLNCTPLGLVDRLRREPAGVDATDEWGWTCLHKASIYGKGDHVIALLDAGASSSLRTRHDPSQIYMRNASALELARFVQEEEWGERGPIISMLESALAGGWVATRSDEERRRLKQQERLRVQEDQLERDISMVAKGEALMRMKLRTQMEDNAQLMREAVERRELAVERQEAAEAAQSAAQQARDAAEQARERAEDVAQVRPC
jgi:hypothetical protein